MPNVIENNKQQKVIVIPLGMTSPAFVDSITENGEKLEGIEEVKFFMRPLLDRHPVIDGESGEVMEPPDQHGNNVKYEWEESDVATEGEFMAWWSFTKDDEEKETPEFPITISDHGPGTGVKTGGIVDGAADHMPVTFTALRNDPNFGDRRLQKYANLIQLRVMGKVVEPDEEIEEYSLPLLDYFSKRLAFELCTPAIDYWARQKRTSSMQSPVEITSYPDMIMALKELRERLACELEEDWRDLIFLVPKLPQRRAVPLPATSLEYEDFTGPAGELIRTNGTTDFVTANPRATPRLSAGFWGSYDLFYTGVYPFP